MYTLLFLILVIVSSSFFVIKYEKKKSEERRILREKKEREEREKEIIKSELDVLSKEIVKDWNSSIHSDKIETPGYDTVIYRFENGDTVFFQGKKLKYTTSTYMAEYILGISYINKFRAIFNRITEIINEGSASKRQKSYSSGSKYYSSTSTSPKTTSSNPRQRRYDIIMETIKLRKEKLMVMSKSDPNYIDMTNELKAAEKKAAEIKMELQQTK